MITSVRFPSAVEVLRGTDSRSTWQVCQLHGITRITFDNGVLQFETNKAGVRIWVFPPPGTVVDVDDSDQERRLIAEAGARMHSSKETDRPVCICGHLGIDHNISGECMAHLRMPSVCLCKKFAPGPTVQKDQANGPASDPPSAEPPRAKPVKTRR